MFRLNNLFLFSPADDDSGSSIPQVGPGGDDKDDVIKFLGEDDEPEEKLDLTEKKDKKEKKEVVEDDDSDESESESEELDEEENEEDDELAALLDETEEPKEEQLELVTPVRRREILNKYPTLFKDFPYLEKAYYREQQFTELFPTIPDAKQAVEKGKSFDMFEKDLMSGNAENLLKVIKDGNSNSFYKIVDDFLPTLARVDNNAYTHVLANTIKHTIISMLTEAKRSNNETLQSAAVILNQFAFGNSEFTAPTRLAKEEKPNDKEDELKTREQQFVKQQFDTATTDLNGRVNNAIMNAINTNIDPKGSMTDYVKRTAVRDANEQLATLIDRDTRFKTIMDRLWEDAFRRGFSRESVDRIKSAYLSKARTLLPSVIKKARNEALKGIGKRVRDTEESGTKSRSQRSSSDKSEKKSAVPKTMSTLEFLNQD